MQRKEDYNLYQKLKRMIYRMMLPLILLLVIVIGLMFFYSRRYNNILHNVTTASEFNQDFKNNIDLEMYYYVVGSPYSTGLPIEDVKEAKALAEDLANTTVDRNSSKAIQSVIVLCDGLEKKINQIAETENYDEREEQLENNIYIITEMIEEYMYTYLYHESVQLDILEKQTATQMLVLEFLAVLLVILIVVRTMKDALEFSRSISDPVYALNRRVESIGEGDLTPREPIGGNVRELSKLSVAFESMAERLKILMEQNKQEQQQLRKAELELIQEQINPHFLYNTLDAVIWLVETEKYQQAETMIENLSDYFRTSLSKGRNIITIQEEERHVASYLQIQKVRYNDILHYDLEIAPELYSYEIPKLTLQPLVENALYHGIKNKRGPGYIRIAGRIKEQRVIFTIEDNGLGIEEERLAELQQALKENQRVGFGMSTVQERIKLLFGEEYGITISSQLQTGTRVTVVIPCQLYEAQKEVEHE